MLDKDIKQIYNNNITNVIQESKTSPDRERGKYPLAEGGGGLVKISIMLI